MYVVETELTISPGVSDQLLTLAKVYRVASQLTAGYIRCELYRRDDGGQEGSAEQVYVLHEAFEDSRAYEANIAAEHARRFEALVASIVTYTPIVTRLRGIVRAPGVPRSPRSARPRFESAIQRLPVVEGENPPTPASPEPRARASRLRLRAWLDRVELAAATETELFGGRPDVCLLVAVYQVAGSESILVGRGLLRLLVGQDAPCVLTDRAFALDTPVTVEKPPARFVIVVVGVEENTGRGVQRTYQLLGGGDSLLIWKSGPVHPAPDSLAAFSERVPRSRSESVQLLLDDVLLADSLEGDTWVGASAAVLEFDDVDRELPSRHRLHDRAAANDWTAYVCTALTFQT